jgi:hypothetical protein
MPCECAKQPLSRSALEDTGAPAPMEIMMAGSSEDICLLVYSPQSPGTRDGPGAAPSREREPESREHVAAPKLPRAESGNPSHGDTWQSRSCSQLRGGSRCLDLKFIREGIQSSGCRQLVLRVERWMRLSNVTAASAHGTSRTAPPAQRLSSQYSAVN